MDIDELICQYPCYYILLCFYFPVEPNPPSPRAVSSNSST